MDALATKRFLSRVNWINWLTFSRQYLIEVEGYQAQVKKYNEDLTDDLARKKARLAAKDAIQPSEEYLLPLHPIIQSRLTKT